MTEKDYNAKLARLVELFMETNNGRPSPQAEAEARVIAVELGANLLSSIAKIADALQTLALHRNGSLPRTPSDKQS